MKRRAKKRILTSPAQPLVCPVDINETWTLDFMRDTLDDSRPFRTLNMIDEGNWKHCVLRSELQSLQPE